MTSSNLFAPCPRCNLLIKQGNHHHVLLCYEALKQHYNKLNKTHNQLLNLLLDDHNDNLLHLFKVIKFRFRSINILLNNTINNNVKAEDKDLEQIYRWSCELANAGNQLLKIMEVQEIE